MGDKNPPIQILMEDFADKHKDRLLFVEEHDCYYWLNKKYTWDDDFKKRRDEYRKSDKVLDNVAIKAIEKTIGAKSQNQK